MTELELRELHRRHLDGLSLNELGQELFMRGRYVTPTSASVTIGKAFRRRGWACRDQRTATRVANSHEGKEARAVRARERKKTILRERKTERQRRWRAKNRKPRPVRVRKPAPVAIPVPIRDAWKRSHRNSILQRKYPTYEALRRAAQEGAFS